MTGVPATAGYAVFEDWQPVIPLTVFGAGVGGAVVIEMAAAVCPSIRAALLTPTEALATTSHDSHRMPVRLTRRAALTISCRADRR
ncbi:hypothetical protein [Streptomyces phaeochromogenes]